MASELANNSFALIIKDHIAKTRSANTHPAKLVVLSNLLGKLFGVKLGELIPGIETKLGSKILGLRGSADLIFSNVVFEIKVNLKQELEDAKKKLQKYFQALLEKEPDKKHIGIATDGIAFIAYKPKVKNGRIIGLSKIGSLNIAEASPSESILWLDSFVFSSPKIVPSAMDLRWRFGPDSATYSVAVDVLGDLWDKIWNERDVTLKLDLWAKNMEIVYGSRPEVASFIDHTYLVTLVKLIVYLRLSGGNVIREEYLKEALTGDYFESYGIANLIEEDFFAWILHPKIIDDTLKLVYGITRELSRYDLSQIDEDFFKEIYQEIVKRSERHRIGEYYTPEWLVELTLKEALNFHYSKNNNPPKILDPACGSGTFLCNAIKLLNENLTKKQRLSPEILEIILENVIGVDINPLAVVIAKANYVIALGDLLKVGKRKIIPVYVADSLKLPKMTRTILGKGDMKVYEHRIEVKNDEEKPKSYSILIPESIVTNKVIFGQVLDSFKISIDSYYIKKNKKEALEAFKKNLIPVLSSDEINVLNSTLSTILKLIDEGNDAIWVFMLSNICAPIILSQSKFDIIVGNPPWIAMRYVENKNYQDFLKEQIFKYNLLDSSQVYLFTQMETATLFYYRSSDLYLKDHGIIAFVMPRSVLTGASHHINFKQFKKPKMKLVKILDVENVSPLFNVPSCVLIAIKGEKTTYPVQTKIYSGKLPEKNVKLSVANASLSVNYASYEPPQVALKRSYYYRQIKAGAAMYPRSFYFIDFDVHPLLGIDARKPKVKSSKQVKKAKTRWKGVELQGTVEAEFIYATLLASDIIHFGYTKMRPVILPVIPTSTGYRLLNENTLRKNGFTYIATWFEKAQKIWKNRAGERTLSQYPTLISQLDYMRALTDQNPTKNFVVLYNACGTNIVSCVVDRNSLPVFHISNTSISPKGFIAENITRFFETKEENEAHYLAAVLNSNAINDRIKPLQTRGIYGARHIHRRPFLFPIPKFDKNNSVHIRLAKLSKKCHEQISAVKFTKKSVAAIRKETKDFIKEELKEIDQLVSKLF